MLVLKSIWKMHQSRVHNLRRNSQALHRIIHPLELELELQQIKARRRLRQELWFLKLRQLKLLLLLYLVKILTTEAILLCNHKQHKLQCPLQNSGNNTSSNTNSTISSILDMILTNSNINITISISKVLNSIHNRLCKVILLRLMGKPNHRFMVKLRLNPNSRLNSRSSLMLSPSLLHIPNHNRNLKLQPKLH